MKVNFVTGNTFKFEIAEQYFKQFNGAIELVQHDIDAPEMQSNSVEEIAQQAAIEVARSKGEPCIKVDVGFFVESLNGFPGPFVKFINDWLSSSDYLKLLDGVEDRKAYFLDATAIGYPDGTSKVFTRKTTGTIAANLSHGPGQWPANDLFIPDGYDRPLGSFTNDEQVQFWGDGCWPDVVAYLKDAA